MVATLPALTLECSGCGHRWPTSARAGSSIRCPRCRRVRRVPANRPRTQAAARAAAVSGDDSEAARLAELWAAEQPAASWLHDLEGPAGHDCPECGAPAQWTGAHTVLICPARHDDGRARRFASPGATERETQHARASTAPERASGPSSAELEQVAEDREVTLDQLEHVRERLGQIPRGDDWRADAIRALRKLGKLEQQYRAVRSAADLNAADTQAAELLGDALDGEGGELRDVLRRADRLTRREQRRDRGSLRFFRRGDSDEYEYLGDDDQADDETPLAETARPLAVPGFMPPDPRWRQHIPRGQWLPHWDQAAPAHGDQWWARYDQTAITAARSLGPLGGASRFCRRCGTAYDPTRPGACPCGRADFGPSAAPNGARR